MAILPSGHELSVRHSVPVAELSLPAQHLGVHAIPLDPATERVMPADPLPAAAAFAELATSPL